MVQERTRASQRSKNASEAAQNGPPLAIKSKVVRRDPEKRRLQNRLAQQTYREKQRKRIEELERRAAGQETDASGTNAGPLPDTFGLVQEFGSDLISDGLGAETINPSYLQTNTGTLVSNSTTDIGSWNSNLFFHDFDQWLTVSPICNQNSTAVLFFNCGCPTLHIPNTSREVLLPVIPDPYKNNLQIDVICIISAMLENCLALGITRSMYCSDDAVSPFYRHNAETDPSSEAIITSVQRVSRTMHFDLRPTRQQIVVNHHPFIDVIPFKDIRDNIIKHMHDIDEDEFFHDSLNHLTCWGSVTGAHTGTPWDSRSWDATEEFLQKWSHIVGGEEGELARNSRWWRSLRGERTVTEIF
ncbi:Ff.00g124030.m01.CDS01 [Fusarium sp. VM40]|nr:Ff.00g124030.m01.CDS01 [Fusarium sp. VM40]